MTRTSATTFALWTIVFAVLVMSNCSDPEQIDSDGGTNTKCAAGLKPMGPACVPIFDECMDDEVPMLGGGCKRVGVKECNGGWGIEGPPDWKCKPIGPPRKCLKGWEKVKGGWCEPTLPKTSCPGGTMEVIGNAACQPIGDCGNGSWGDIKTNSSTIYVDKNYKGANPSGTKSRPYLTIAAALDKASLGTQIAVAAGTYKENLIISLRVTLEGRCPQKVTIKGVSAPQATVQVLKIASGTILRGFTISGASTGLALPGPDVTVERMAVHGSGGCGIVVLHGGTLTVRDSLVAENRGSGIALFSSKAIVERTVVRDNYEGASDIFSGRGIVAQFGSGQSVPSELKVRDSLVTGNRDIGIIVFSSKVTIDRTVVRDTRERASNKRFGRGISIQIQSGHSLPSELTVRDSWISRNREVGIAIINSKATVERTVVQDTRERASDNMEGAGIKLWLDSSVSLPSDLKFLCDHVEGTPQTQR